MGMSTDVGFWIAIIQIDGMLSLQLSPNRGLVSYPRQLSIVCLSVAGYLKPFANRPEPAAILNSVHEILCEFIKANIHLCFALIVPSNDQLSPALPRVNSLVGSRQ